jgi:hypothetical protein
MRHFSRTILATVALAVWMGSAAPAEAKGGYKGDKKAPVVPALWDDNGWGDSGREEKDKGRKPKPKPGPRGGGDDE